MCAFDTRTLQLYLMVYAAASVTCLVLLALVVKAKKRCAEKNNTSTSPLEAFAYDETMQRQDEEQSRRRENEANVDAAYHNLAGSHPTTPAVF